MPASFNQCRGTGYYGRTGIFEICPVDEAVKPLILKGADASEIKREVVKNGMPKGCPKGCQPIRSH